MLRDYTVDKNNVIVEGSKDASADAREYLAFVGKALDWVYLESQDTTVFRPTYAAEKYADFVAGGTMLGIALLGLLANPSPSLLRRP